MHCLRRMEKCAVDSHAVHRCDHLLADLTTLSHARDDQLASSANALRDLCYRIAHIIPRQLLRQIYTLQMCQGRALCRDDMDRSDNGGWDGLGYRNLGLIWIWWGHW